MLSHPARLKPDRSDNATLVDLVVHVVSDCDRSTLDSRLLYHVFRLIVSHLATVDTCTGPQKKRCPNISATPFAWVVTNNSFASFGGK
jgi:hypothetical protein